MMRIITGKARGTHLYTLEGTATRPTSERAKEAVFSMLQFSISGVRVLDLFAGSGQLALEALSRGASFAVLADASPAAVDIIRRNAEKTRLIGDCKIIRADYAETIRRCAGIYKFDLVFLDPPYNKGLVAESIRLLLQNDVLADGATLVCESEDADVFSGMPELCSFEIIKSARYGVARMTLLRYTGSKTNE